MRTIILKAASRHIPSGRHRINTEPVPSEILEKMRARDDLRSRDPTSPALQQMNDEITRTTNEHRRNTWRQFVETLDHRTDPSKLWRTIKAIDGKSPPKAENEAITFGDIQVSSPKQIANYFNRQFTTSKLGRHTSSRETRIVSREIKRKSLMSAVTFTTDQVIKGISNCSNTKAFGPDKLSIFHLKNLGPRAIEYLTAIINGLRHIMPNPGDLEVIYCHPYPQTRQGLFSRNFISANLTTLPGSESYGGSNTYRWLTHTGFQLLTNTDSEPDTQPLLLYYN